MKTSEALQNSLDGIVDLIKSPAGLANLYSEFSSDQQAQFWDEVARNFKDFAGGGGCYQNCGIAGNLSERAMEHIKNLYDHIKLNETEESQRATA